jgi:DNA primase
MVDSQERDICSLTEKLRELQLQLQQSQQTQNPATQQQNSNPSNRRNKAKNISNNNNASSGNKNNRGNNNGNSNNAQQMRNNQQQQQQQAPSQQQRARPPPLIKTVIYEEENENELYEEQLREERENATRFVPIPANGSSDFTVELLPESPDYATKNGNFEEISEALIVPEHETLNQRVIPSPTPDDFKNQEIAVEVISTIEPSHFQIIPMENGIDLELD